MAAEATVRKMKQFLKIRRRENKRTQRILEEDINFHSYSTMDKEQSSNTESNSLFSIFSTEDKASTFRFKQTIKASEETKEFLNKTESLIPKEDDYFIDLTDSLIYSYMNKKNVRRL